MYALGCVLGELLAGKVFFKGLNASQVFARKCQYGHLCESLPADILDKQPALSKLLNSLTHPEREQRPENYHDIIQQCQSILDENSPVDMAKTADLPVQIIKPPKAALYALVGLVVFTIVYLITAGKEQNTLQTTSTHTLETIQQSVLPTKLKKLKEIIIAPKASNLIAVSLQNRLNEWQHSGVWIGDEEGSGIVGNSSRSAASLSRELSSAYGKFKGRVDLQQAQSIEIQVSSQVTITIQKLYSNCFGGNDDLF